MSFNPLGTAIKQATSTVNKAVKSTKKTGVDMSPKKKPSGPSMNPKGMSWDPSQHKWTLSPGNTSKQVVNKPSTSKKAPTTKKTGGSGGGGAATDQTQVNSSGKAEQAQAVLEYNTLEADLALKTSASILKVKQDTTINIEGVGSFLSGQYYVTEVTYTLDNSSGFSMSCSVIKTGFGPSLKGPVEETPAAPAEEPRKEEVPKQPDNTVKKGSKVRIVGAATYTNGVKVPDWVKQKDLTVQQVSSDGTKVLLQPIVSWTYTKFVQVV